MGSENRKLNRFSALWCRNPHKALASLVLFDSSEKKRAFRALDCRHDSSPHRTRIMTKLGGRMLH